MITKVISFSPKPNIIEYTTSLDDYWQIPLLDLQSKVI